MKACVNKTAFTILLFITGLLGIKAQNTGKDNPLVVGSDMAYPPFEYIGQDGAAKGYNIDVLRAISEETGIEMVFHLQVWSEVLTGIESDSIDILSGLFYDVARSGDFIFSNPHSVVSYCAFFHKSSPSINGVEDLEGKTILVQRGDIAAVFLRENVANCHLIEVDSPLDALKLLATKNFDGAVLSRLQGLHFIKQHQLNYMAQPGSTLFSRNYCFAAKPHNPEIILALNEGLRLIKESGEFSRINNKWFGVLEQENFFSRYRRFILISLAITMGCALAAAFWIYSLNLKVAQKTQQLQKELEHKKETEHLLLTQKKEISLKNKEIEAHNKALQKKNKELTDLMQELALNKQAAKFKQQFLANMSHEIRTPMTGIMGMASILAKTPLNNQQKDYLQSIQKASDNLLHIINDILDLSKIEAGKMTLRPETIILVDFFNEIKDYYAATAKHRNIHFDFTISDEVPLAIKADPHRLRQVLTNLLSNAFKFTEKGSIHFYLKKISDHSLPLVLQVDVRDTGVGITIQNTEKLFEKFFQLDNSLSRTAQGTGLGLAICKQLVELMGGKISVVSERNKGSTFSFTFQAQKVDLARLAQTNKPFIEHKLGMHILLAEDKLVNQKVVSLMLKHWGCTLEIANNGLEALQLYKDDQFDMILMDIQMPVMDGISCMKELRKQYQNTAPIIGLSANAMEGDAEKYIQEGLDDYLSKPFTQEALFHKLLLWKKKKK